MNDIRCPHCKKSFKADEVFAHHLDDERKKFEDEKNRLRDEAKEWRAKKEKELLEEAEKINKRHEQELRAKLEREMELTLKDSKNEAEELVEKNRKQQQELLEMNKAVRLMKSRHEELELENQKKLAEAEDSIKEAARKKAEEQAHFKVLELEKRLTDVSKVNEDLKRKLEQGSQQMQGEVLELEFENTLMREFPYDEIKPVPKGVRGADILHVVRSSSGATCGTIIWEFKRTKAWSNDWIVKLKDDQRAVKADIAVIISIVIPESIKVVGESQGVVIGEYVAVLGIAKLLRMKLIEESALKSSTQNMEGKRDLLYTYVRSTDFRHRVEAIAEAFKHQQDILEKEKRWFALKWAKQEKIIRKMSDNMFGMMGELEGIIGKELEGMNQIEMLPDEIEVEVSVEEQLF